ncbi:MAG: DNA repair protein RecN [Leptospiraceae bacterium]|nr:DNA repair protein RecN [Leptospiraceae bacterium]
MLVELNIENFGIIENLKFRPGKGLNIITGETGSGKSLIIQAIGVVLGEKAGTGYLRNGTNKAIIEAIFDLSKKEHKKKEILNYLEQLNIPIYDDNLVLKREILLDGRPRAYINQQQVSIAILKEIGSKLVEIHGQHENQRLLDPSFHLDFVDIYGGLEGLREKVSNLYRQLIENKKKLKSVSLMEEEKKFRKDFLQYAIKEIEEFHPKEGEFEELQKERAMILNSGKLYEDLAYAYSVLQEEDHSVNSVLQSVEKILEKHSGIYQDFQETLELLQDSIYNLESVIDFIREKKLKMNFSTERLEDIEERLEGYRKLYKKYGANTTLLLQKKEEYKRELNSIEMSDEERELLRSQIQAMEQELTDLAEELSEKRKSIIPLLEEKLANELEQLGMKNTKIQISLSREVATENNEDSNNLEQFKLHEKGYDYIEFLFCANEGEVLLPLRKVASGGELSRIALAMKSIIMDKFGPLCVIFDEIDTGVGGETAFVLGKKLKDISVNEQVIVITHLHQVASMADKHFKIYKQTKNSRTYTQIERLMREDRLKELARMLGGTEPIVYEHAKEILFKAQEYSTERLKSKAV